MFKLRPASDADLPFLLRLREQTMLQHLVNAGVELDADAQLARVMYRFDCAKIVVINGRDSGLIKVNREGDTWELIQLQVSPELQGKGVGRALIEQLLSEAKVLRVGVELSVLKANPARELYEKLGFRVISEDQFEYSMRFVI